MDESTPLLEFRQVSIEFGGLQALKQVSFAVKSLESVGVLVGGANGAGKSTAINLASGLYRPSSGTVWFRGRNITGHSLDEIARMGLVRTFQHSRVFAGLTVRENVRIGCDTTGCHGYRETDQRASQLVADFGLIAVADRTARELSYGQRRLLEIARAMGTSPRLLLLDEPAAGLAPEEYGSLIAALRNVRRKGVSLLLIEHIQEVFSALTEYALILDHGRLVFAGALAEMWHAPAVRQAYLSVPQVFEERAHISAVSTLESTTVDEGPSVFSRHILDDHGLERQRLTVKKLCANYGSTPVLGNVSFSVKAGSVTGLWGLNGAGKSTLLRGLMGLVSKTGSVTLDDKDITHLSTHQIVRRGMTLIPEGRQVFPHMSVQENLEIGGYNRLQKGRHKEKLGRVFEQFPLLKKRAFQLAGSLSGGEQQLLALGRGLMSGATILLIDEPFLGLSPINIETVIEALGDIKSSGVGILLAEEKLDVLMRVTQRVLILKQGHLVETPVQPSPGPD